MNSLEHGKDTRGDRGRKRVVERPDGLCFGYAFHLSDFFDSPDKPSSTHEP